MFCIKCGNEIPEDSRFCDKCGANQMVENIVAEEGIAEEPAAAGEQILTPVAETMPSNEPTGGKEPKIKLSNRVLISGGIGIVAVIAVIVVAFNLATNSGTKYLYSTVNKSVKYYESEIEKFFSANSVMKQTKKLMNGSSTQIVTTGFFKATLNNDRKAKVLNGNVAIMGVPARLDFFLTDKRLVVGSKSLMYLEADPANLGGDIAQFADNNGVFAIGDALERVLAPVDFSYSKVAGLNFYEPTKEMKQLEKRYIDVFKTLIDKSDFQKTKSTIEIGNKSVKCDLLTIKMDNDIVLEWIKNDLGPAIKLDKELEAWINDLADITDAYYDYDDLKDWIVDAIAGLEKLDKDFEVTVKLSVYKGVIVKAELDADDDYYPGFHLKAEATGEKYRLDRVSMTVDNGYFSEYSFTAQGNHIGSAVFDSEIKTYYNGKMQNKMTIEWDSNAASNNLVLKAGGISVKMAFAVDGDTVKFVSSKDLYPTFSWVLKPLDAGKVELPLPEDTVTFRDITAKDILEAVGDISSLVPFF